MGEGYIISINGRQQRNGQENDAQALSTGNGKGETDA